MTALSEQTGPLRSTDPATGETIASFPIAGPQDIAVMVERARSAASWWTGLGEPGRRERLRAWRSELVRRTGELAELVHRENGKSVDDAVLEITIAIAHLDWATRKARTVLGRRRVKPGLLAINHRADLAYRPFGVIAVIGPWNYPVHTPMGSISYALAAGNAVIFKPSEFTPAVGAWLVDSFAAMVEDRSVLQLCTGAGETGAELCRAGVDKVAFTGSAGTGRKVLAACAETLTPSVIECGGKDAVIVAADADVEQAAARTVWGAMFNAGQTCAGVERAYVDEHIYDEFVTQVVEQAATLRPGTAATSPYGPITMPSQLRVIADHIDDALVGGGRAVVGGRESVRPPFVDPVVLVDVDAESPALTEETFGPTLVVVKVADSAEAVAASNAGRYGLGAAVFSRRHGREIAEQLDAGMVSINSVLSYASIPGLPWGGSKESGFGRIHGPDGLHEFARSHATTQPRWRSPLVLDSFSRSAHAVDRLSHIARLRWGRRPRR